jgi:hypothetical protein
LVKRKKRGIFIGKKISLKMIEAICQKIGELLTEGSREENLRIAFPRWFGRYLQHDVFIRKYLVMAF